MQQQQQQQQPRQVGGSTSSSFFPFLPSLPPPASHLVPHHNNSHHNSVALIDNSKRDGAAGAAVVTVVPNGYNDMMMTGIGYPFPDGGNPLASANANGSATAGAGVSVNGKGGGTGRKVCSCFVSRSCWNIDRAFSRGQSFVAIRAISNGQPLFVTSPNVCQRFYPCCLSYIIAFAYPCHFLAS